MRAIARLLVLTVLVVTILFIGTPARAAETILYDVTTSTFTFFTSPVLHPSTTERIQITDRGPQTDGSPRWTTESLGQVAVWDEPGSFSAPDLLLFGNSCADVPSSTGSSLPRLVQVNAAGGGGNFAWVPGLNPIDGTFDNVASFCLKWSHQSTTTWSEQVSIGKRVYAAPPPPPPSPVKVFITQPKASATVSGTVWVVLWVEGTSGASNVFTLSADGTQVRTQTTSSRGPVTLPWPTVGTTPVPNGTHTLTGTVRDATGNTGTTSITVILKN
jgi:hypothetical protein